MLGFTTGTGLAFTQIQANGISNALGQIGSWFSDIFAGEASPSPQSPSTPLDPFSLISPTLNQIAEATTTVVGLVPQGYEWIQTKENSEFLVTFLKNFLNYSFVKTVVFRLHLIIRAWSGIFTNTKELLKFPGAFKTFQALAKFLSKNGNTNNQNGNKEMINWLFIRFMVHPRNMIRVLYKGWNKAGGQSMDENKLKCNGKGKKGRGSKIHCFICQDGKNLTEEMKNFLQQGKSPVTAQKK